jgi:hypothetical protein
VVRVVLRASLLAIFYKPWSGRPRLGAGARIAVEIMPHLQATGGYGEAAIADKAIAYWHLAGKLSVAKSAVLRRLRNCAEALAIGRVTRNSRAQTARNLLRMRLNAAGFSSIEQ